MIYEAHKHKCIMKNGNRTSIRKNDPALVCFHENSLIKLNFCAINQVSLQYQSNPILNYMVRFSGLENAAFVLRNLESSLLHSS